MRKLAILFAMCAIPASAESVFSAGVIGGAPFTDVVSATNQNNLAFISTSTNFTVGPSFQVNLPLSLRIEVDALYRPYSFTASSTVSPPFATSIAPIYVSGSQWAFPVLAQYRFSVPVVKPFVEVGVSFDHLSNLSTAANEITSGTGA